jgi:hypothetical protein
MADYKIKSILSILLLVLLISITSAVTVDTNPIILSESITSVQLHFSDLTTNNVSLGLSSNLDGYARLQFDYVNINEAYARVYLDNIPSTNISGFLFFGSQDVPLNIISSQATPVATSSIIIFPTSKIVTLQQGITKTQSITVTVPSNYPRPVTFHSVDFNPEIEAITLGDLNLGQVSPGNSISIPIVFHGEDAQTGTYSTQLSIYATDEVVGQLSIPTVSITLQITTGVSPVTTETFSTAPTCTLSATTMNTNNTYYFTCTGVVSNLDIDIPSSDYYVGKSVDITSSLYTYSFMPIKYGTTSFIAEFKYNGASIFAPFKQNIILTSAGSIISGTNLRIVLTPTLEDSVDGKEFYIIQVVDNISGSLVENPKLFIDAVEINSTSSYSFRYAFIPSQNYTIRARSTGYEDMVQYSVLDFNSIEITASPTTGDISTLFNITTSVQNATIYIQNKSYVNNYYGVLPGGVLEIRAEKEGYKTKIINFTVDDRIKIISFGAEFKKGVSQNFTLSGSGNWVVYYKKDLSQTDRSELIKGVGNLVAFTPKKTGAYVIEVDGAHVGTFSIDGFSFSNKWWFMPAWVWLLIAFFIILIILFSRKSRTPDKGGGAGFDMHVGNN